MIKNSLSCMPWQTLASPFAKLGVRSGMQSAAECALFRGQDAGMRILTLEGLLSCAQPSFLLQVSLSVCTWPLLQPKWGSPKGVSSATPTSTSGSSTQTNPTVSRQALLNEH